jgi:hypothetical protein
MTKKQKQLAKNADEENEAAKEDTNATTKLTEDMSHQSKQRENEGDITKSNKQGDKKEQMSDRCGKLKAKIKGARTKSKRGHALHAYMMCKRGK